MILRPIKHGKKRAIVLTDQILEEAELSKSGQIQLTTNPGGLFLQTVRDSNEEACLASFKKVKRKYSRLFRRLADM